MESKLNLDQKLIDSARNAASTRGQTLKRKMGYSRRIGGGFGFMALPPSARPLGSFHTKSGRKGTEMRNKEGKKKEPTIWLLFWWYVFFLWTPNYNSH